MDGSEFGSGVTIQVGSELKGIVLDVDPVKRIVDLNVRKASVRQRSKKVQVSKAIAEGADVRARVELCKDDYVGATLQPFTAQSLTCMHRSGDRFIA